MPATTPFYLRVCISVCGTLAHICASLQCGLANVGLLKISSHLTHDQERHAKLRDLAYTELVRRMISMLVRSMLRRSVLRLVDMRLSLPMHTGCVIVSCHTPWKRLLVQWCLDNDFGMIITAGKKTHDRQRILRSGKGLKEMREMMKFLELNGRVVVAADVFNHLHDCPVHFLGSEKNASMLPIRLAKLAGVPLITALPKLVDGRIVVEPGPIFDPALLDSGEQVAMQNLVELIENEIRRNPCIWG